MSLFSLPLKLSTIFGLLGPGSPSAISGLVIAIVVWETIKRQFSAWSSSHIGEKVPEIHPFFAYLNSTTAVIFPSICIWISASLNHSGPNFIFGSLFFTGTIAMFEISFTLKTATTPCTVWCGSADASSREYFYGSAIAETLPSWSGTARKWGRHIWCPVENQKSTKFLTSQVNKVCYFSASNIWVFFAPFSSIKPIFFTFLGCANE